jgi:hypothetical protein
MGKLNTGNKFLSIDLDKIRVFDGSEEVARLQLNDDYELEVYKTADLTADVKKTATRAEIRTLAVKKTTAAGLDPVTAEDAVVDSDSDTFLNQKYVVDTNNNFIVASSY